MVRYLIVYFFAFTVFLALDYVWLTQVAKGFYHERLQHLLLESPKLLAAAIFYAVYVVGIIYFAVRPGIAAENATIALLNGAMFGFFAYATYDMTNYATLRGWPLSVSLVDITWGTFVTSISAFAGFWISTFV